MSIKADRWIRQMALEHGMIEPFVENQVRSGVISYGLSSYGYDIRVSDEFKIFTNVHSAIVDPKHFNPQSFVDFKGNVCVIPPNSFVLAKTVEYFRIPRDVLTVCVGKCVTGDTRVVDAETGAYLPIRELAHLRQTVGLTGWQMGSVMVSDFIPNGRRPVYKLTTKTGLTIRATANHPFRQIHGWTPLSDLKPGDRIAAARQIPCFGKTPLADWEAALLGLMIAEGQCHTPGHSPTFTTQDPVLVALLQHCVQEGLKGEITFKGRMGYRLVNKRGRGGVPEKNRASLWLEKYGLNVAAEQKFVPQAIFRANQTAVTLFLRALFAGDGSIYQSNQGVYLEYYSNSLRLIEDVHHLLLRFGIVSLIRHKQTAVGTTAYRLQITDRAQIQRFAETIGFWPESLKQVRLEQEILPLLAQTPRQKSNFDTLPAEGWGLLRQAAEYTGQSLHRLGVKHTQPEQSLAYAVALPVAKATQYPDLVGLMNGPLWDVVTSIEYDGEEEVYDLTVPGAHNFVANDLIVHNSTYARCFSGDTEVVLVDGRSISLEEMARRADDGELFWGYSLNDLGRIVVTLLEAPRYIGCDALLEITLDNEQKIRCTPDHYFALRDGRWIQAHELRPDSRLMPLDRSLWRGYEMVYQPLNGLLSPTHRLADEWNLRHEIYADEPQTHRHHKDHIRRNNNPWNIVRMNATDHIKHHNEMYYGPDFDATEHSLAIQQAFADLAKDPQWKENFAKAQQQRAKLFWHDPVYAQQRMEVIKARLASWTPERRHQQSEALRQYYELTENRLMASEISQRNWAKDDGTRRLKQQEIARQINLRPEITSDDVAGALHQTGSIRGAARLLNCDRSVFRRFQSVVAQFRSSPRYRNHKVISVKELPGDHDVYCLTVPEAGNFGLAAGVFVQNCGLIVNVTPFEPEWEGTVTLEISNTTPLPARVYANEGIAQVLFFQSDEVCETSYADKKGKYQGQQTIELPKIDK